MAGALNVDRIAGRGADLVHDLDSVPWPIKDACFERIVATDVLEHLADIVAAMEEIHRIGQPNAIVSITVPHYSCSNTFTDPTHRRAFGFFSFDYFTGESALDFYTGIRFRRRHVSLIFTPTPVNKIVSRLANRYPARYERRWAWMFPAWFLYLELEVIKERRSPSGGSP